MRHLVVLTTAAFVVIGASPAVAQPGPSPAPSPTATSPAPPTPFPFPTVPAPSEVPLPSPFEPAGPPIATTTRHGIRVELWLSATSVAPGEWIQAVVRTSNLGDRPAWAAPGACDASGTGVGVDLQGVIPPGIEQTGNAARFKERAIRDSGVLRGAFQAWRSAATVAAGSGGIALAECAGSWVPHRLRGGARTVERFAWYPAWTWGDDALPHQPLPPGTVTVTASWPFLTRGAAPPANPEVEPSSDRIGVSVPLELTGEGPGTPSVPELVDRALVDAEWAAWVARDPDRSSWSYVWATMWAGPDYPDHPLFAGVVDPNPWGVMEFELIQGRLGLPGTRGAIMLDPWTGEILDVAYH